MSYSHTLTIGQCSRRSDALHKIAAWTDGARSFSLVDIQRTDWSGEPAFNGHRPYFSFRVDYFTRITEGNFQIPPYPYGGARLRPSTARTKARGSLPSPYVCPAPRLIRNPTPARQTMKIPFPNGIYFHPAPVETLFQGPATAAGSYRVITPHRVDFFRLNRRLWFSLVRNPGSSTTANTVTQDKPPRWMFSLTTADAVALGLHTLGWIDRCQAVARAFDLAQHAANREHPKP